MSAASSAMGLQAQPQRGARAPDITTKAFESAYSKAAQLSDDWVWSPSANRVDAWLRWTWLRLVKAILLRNKWMHMALRLLVRQEAFGRALRRSARRALPWLRAARVAEAARGRASQGDALRVPVL